MEIKEQIQCYTGLWRETMVIYEAWAQRRGLSYCELLVALSLSETAEACTQKQICRQWQLPKQTVHTVLKDFQKREWVTLLPLESDRRNKEIRLTPSGKEHIHSLAGDLFRCETEAFRKLGKDQADALLRTTTRYNQKLKEALSRENA